MLRRFSQWDAGEKLSWLPWGVWLFLPTLVVVIYIVHGLYGPFRACYREDLFFSLTWTFTISVGGWGLFYLLLRDGSKAQGYYMISLGYGMGFQVLRQHELFVLKAEMLYLVGAAGYLLCLWAARRYYRLAVSRFLGLGVGMGFFVLLAFALVKSSRYPTYQGYPSR
ncbi:MAG: hypothetical protein ACUVRD_06705 [Bacteroidia bacterium]